MIGISNELRSGIRAVKPAQEESSISSFVGGVIGMLSSDIGLSSTDDDGGLKINGFEIYANVTSDITIYGTPGMSGVNNSGISYTIYASKLVGGYNGSDSDLSPDNFGCSVTNSGNYSTISLILTFNNLRNGNGGINVDDDTIPFAQEYEIKISSFMFGVEVDDKIAATIKNSSVPVGEEISANFSYANYKLEENQ